MKRALGFAAALAASVTLGQTPAPTLQVSGADGVAKTLSLADLRALPQMEFVDSSPASGPVRFRGPSVRSILTLIDAPEGRALRGPNMTLVVVAEARDAYKVAYSLTELDPQFAADTALVALTQNGQPLSAEDGPLRIVFPGEKTHHARWIRQLTALRVVNVAK